MLKGDEKDVEDVLKGYFELGKTKELDKIEDFLAPAFHKFGEAAPYERRNIERASTLEQMYFANLSDFEYRIDDLKIEVFDDVALATFIVETSGMVVDDYSFRGTTVKTRSRATVVFRRLPIKGWKMLHQHYSKFID